MVAIAVIFVLSGLKILNEYERSPGAPDTIPRYTAFMDPLCDCCCREKPDASLRPGLYPTDAHGKRTERVPEQRPQCPHVQPFRGGVPGDVV